MMTTNVREYGALGDGVNDDTPAVRKAMEPLPEKGGVVYFPAGTYRLDTIRCRSCMTFRADRTWSYRDAGGTVIIPLTEKQACIFDARRCIGTHFEGLSLEGEKKGQGMHGLISTRLSEDGSKLHEQDLHVVGCAFQHFSGSGCRFAEAWTLHIRHSLFHQNMEDGIDASGSYDCWIVDNILAGNERYGIGGDIFAAATLTGNRVEWNGRAGIRIGPEYSDNVQITSNFFDANMGPAIEICGRQMRCISVTANTFRRNGYKRWDEPEQNCHLRFENVKGLTVTGNSFDAGSVRFKPEDEPESNPDYAITVKNLKQSVIMANAGEHGAMKAMIRDEGGHEYLVLKDNPGSLQDSPGGRDL